MSKDLSRADWDNDQPTDVDRWLEIYSQDDNLFWSTDQGHILNVLDELLERLKTAKAQAWTEGYKASALGFLSGTYPKNPYRDGENSE